MPCNARNQNDFQDKNASLKGSTSAINSSFKKLEKYQSPLFACFV